MALDTGIHASMTVLIRFSCWSSIRKYRGGQLIFPFYRAAVIVIHSCLWDAVVLAGVPEPRHREVKLCVTQVPENSQVTVHGTGYRHPCRHDGSNEIFLLIKYQEMPGAINSFSRSIAQQSSLYPHVCETPSFWQGCRNPGTGRWNFVLLKYLRTAKLPSMALDTGIHASMTVLIGISC